MAPVALPVLGKLAMGAVAVGTLAKAAGDIQAGNAHAEALGQDALATNQDALALRQDALAIRQSADQVEAEAQASDYNAALSERSAFLTRQQYAENERRLRIQSAKGLGEERARFGAAGVTLSGSALDVIQESAAAAELDALTLRHEGELKAIAFENEANLNRARAASSRRNATNIRERAGYAEERAGFVDQKADFIRGQADRSRTAGYLNAVGSLAGGGTTLLGVLRK